MGRRFSVFLFCLWIFSFSARAGGLQASGHTETSQNAEALQMIEERMKSLTRSLNHLPQPPVFDQKIDLPVLPALPVTGKQDAVQAEKEKQKKEKEKI